MKTIKISLTLRKMANRGAARNALADSLSLFLETQNPRTGRLAIVALCAVAMLSMTTFLIHSSSQAATELKTVGPTAVLQVELTLYTCIGRSAYVTMVS